MHIHTIKVTFVVILMTLGSKALCSSDPITAAERKSLFSCEVL